jgi:hypothetical protein
LVLPNSPGVTAGTKILLATYNDLENVKSVDAIMSLSAIIVEVARVIWVASLDKGFKKVCITL